MSLEPLKLKFLPGGHDHYTVCWLNTINDIAVLY